jgi:hypothetical protein
MASALNVPSVCLEMINPDRHTAVQATVRHGMACGVTYGRAGSGGSGAVEAYRVYDLSRSRGGSKRLRLVALPPECSHSALPLVPKLSYDVCTFNNIFSAAESHSGITYASITQWN